MKKTCNYCRAYDPSGWTSGTCMLGYKTEFLTDDELKKYVVIPYNTKGDFRYTIGNKPKEKCPAPRTWKDLYSEGWGA